MELSAELIRQTLDDMAARRYMNALGELQSGNTEEAVFEAGGGHALQQMKMMVEYFEAEGEWPGDTPNDVYISFVEALEDTNSEEGRPPGFQ